MVDQAERLVDLEDVVGDASSASSDDNESSVSSWPWRRRLKGVCHGLLRKEDGDIIGYVISVYIIYVYMYIYIY